MSGRAPFSRTISALLAEGAIDGFIAPRPPSLPRNTPNVGWLFTDPVAAAQDYFYRTGIFPIMHLLGRRRSIADQHPWLPAALFKAFSKSKDIALDLLTDPSASRRQAAEISGTAEIMIISTLSAGLASAAEKQAREGGAMPPTHSSQTSFISA
jgi:hypothetical protein